jgi:hypothetical protein
MTFARLTSTFSDLAKTFPEFFDFGLWIEIADFDPENEISHFVVFFPEFLIFRDSCVSSLSILTSHDDFFLSTSIDLFDFFHSIWTSGGGLCLEISTFELFLFLAILPFREISTTFGRLSLRL